MNLSKRILIASTLAISSSLAVFIQPARAAWITPPTPFSTPFGNWGLDGIPGTADDPLWFVGEVRGIISGYRGGIYQRPPGRVPGEVGGILTAETFLISSVTAKGNNKFDYLWELTNTGTGDLVSYIGPTPPRFIKQLNNFGLPELDGTAGPLVDLTISAAVDIDLLLDKGPPVISQWRGRWNPEAEDEVPLFVPVPEPTSTLGLLALGTISAASVLRCNKKQKK